MNSKLKAGLYGLAVLIVSALGYKQQLQQTAIQTNPDVLDEVFKAPQETPKPKAPEPIPDGYLKLADGVYGRWCHDSCIDPSELPSYVRNYAAMEVWCKSFECGSTYAKVNFQRDGVTVADDNELLTLGLGERAIMTFTTSKADVNGYRLAEFEALGF